MLHFKPKKLKNQFELKMETKFVKSDSFSAERAGLIKLSIKTVETFGKNVIILVEIQGVFENIAIEFERNSEIMFQLFL